MFTGTVATCGIPVDLHTLAVSIVSKKKIKIETKIQSAEGSEGQYVRSSVGRGGRLGDGSW